MNTTITMRDFFLLPEVIACQEIQKRNPHGSQAHRGAYEKLLSIARAYAVSQWINEY